MDTMSEKRRQPRRRLNGYTADIASAGLVYTATVEDVSLKGLQLQGLPATFTAVKGEQFYVVVSDFEDMQHFKLTVHSKWRKKDGRLVILGFAIINAPTSWNRFIRKEIPQQNHGASEEDVWDQYAGTQG